MAVLNPWQKISRVFPGQTWGDGKDGAATISSNPNYIRTFTGTAGNTTGTAGGASLANGDLVLLHHTQGGTTANVGQWEFNKIVSGGGTYNLTFAVPLQYTYDGKSQIIRVPRYTTATVSGYSVQAWDGNTGGISVICAKESIVGGAINGNGYGFRFTETSANQGEGTNGGGADSRLANGNGGGGGNNNNEGGGGGGGGANANNGNAGTIGDEGTRDYGRGGNSAGSNDLTNMVLGGAGGTGGSSWGKVGGKGAKGGAALMLFSKLIQINNPNTTNGNNGTTPADADHPGGGGGGAAGNQLYVAEIIIFSTTCTATGGVKGNGRNKGGDGGNGSVGRIAVHYRTSVSGTTSPAYTGVQDTSLKSQIYGGMV